MFDQLDDPMGVPERPGRPAQAKARGRVLRLRRLAALPAAALFVAGTAVLVADGDDEVLLTADDPVPCVPVTTIPGTPPLVDKCRVPITVTSAPSIDPSRPAPGHSITTTIPSTAPGAPVVTSLTTPLAEEGGSGVTGRASATRIGAFTWRITVEVRGVRAGRRYHVLVARPEPTHGTPFPTACEFVAGDGCTGHIEVYEGRQPTNVSVMGPDGAAVAQGRFAP